MYARNVLYRRDRAFLSENVSRASGPSLVQQQQTRVALLREEKQKSTLVTYPELYVESMKSTTTSRSQLPKPNFSRTWIHCHSGSANYLC